MANGDNLAVRILISAQDNASKTFEFIRANGAKLAEGLAAALAIDLFKGAVDDAAKFEAQLDKVGSKGGYTSQEMDTLSKAAVEIGSYFFVSHQPPSADAFNIQAIFDFYFLTYWFYYCFTLIVAS